MTKTANFYNPRWRTAAILKIAKITISQSKILRFWWNLVHYIPYWARLQSCDAKIKIFKIQDGGGRHLENWFVGHNSSTDCPISAKFCMKTRATWQKLQIFEIQDGGRPPFLKSLNRHISVKNCSILMKCGTLHQILNPITVSWPKIEIFKISDGGGRHLKNRFFGHNSSTDCPISATFCMRKQNGM